MHSPILGTCVYIHARCNKDIGGRLQSGVNLVEIPYHHPRLSPSSVLTFLQLTPFAHVTRNIFSFNRTETFYCSSPMATRLHLQTYISGQCKCEDNYIYVSLLQCSKAALCYRYSIQCKRVQSLILLIVLLFFVVLTFSKN